MNKLWMLVLLLGCAPEKPPPGAAGPLEAVKSFSDAVQKGDPATAWSLLSERTRRAADEAARTARTASGRSAPESGREMLFSSALPAGTGGAQLVSQSADTAQVRTLDPDGGKGPEFRVVRENGAWRVDLALGR
jgi:hypothetical protein